MIMEIYGKMEVFPIVLVATKTNNKCVPGTREMAQWIKSLLYNYEDPGSDPQHTHNSGLGRVYLLSLH